METWRDWWWDEERDGNGGMRRWRDGHQLMDLSAMDKGWTWGRRDGWMDRQMTQGDGRTDERMDG